MFCIKNLKIGKLFKWFGYQNNSSKTVNNNNGQFAASTITFNNNNGPFAASTINGNVVMGDPLKQFKLLNKSLKNELENLQRKIRDEKLKLKDLKIDDLRTLQHEFDEVETEYKQVKINHANDLNVSQFPNIAKHYYEIIIPIYKMQDFDVSIYKKRLKDYSNASQN